MWYKTVFEVVAVITLMVYTVGIGVFECYIGGRSASLVSEYYDYSVPINGTSISIAIDALPRDVYKNTKDVASTYLIFGVLGILGVLCFIVCFTYSKLVGEINKSYLILVVAASDAAAVLVPFCYSAFITWKLYSLSDNDIKTWDTVNPEFIQLFRYSEKLMIATVVPGCFWAVVACFLIVTGDRG